MINRLKGIRPEKLLAIFSSFCLLLSIIAVWILNTIPPVSRDALTHHLFIPKLWILQGSIAPISHIPFSYYPMNLDLLYYISLLFNNDIVPKYLHYFFALLTGLIIYRYLSPRLSKAWGLFGALFFLTIPVIIRLSTTVYVDLGLVAFSTASLLLVFKWASTRQLRHLVFAGFCCGLAAGTKYNGLIHICILTLLLPLIYSRFQIQQNTWKTGVYPIMYMVFFLLVTLLSYSPWLIRNYMYTGNPIYPLYNAIFIKETPVQNIQKATTQENSKQEKISETNNENAPSIKTPFVARRILYGERWWQAVLLPARYFFEGRDDDPRYFDGKLNPFLLLFIFFVFFKHQYSTKTRLELIFLCSFAWLFFFFSFFQGSLRIRYIAPSLPAFVILATFGINNIYQYLKDKTDGKAVTAFIILPFLILPPIIYNFKYINHLIDRYKPLSYLSGQISREDYIAKYLPEYSVIKYANEQLKEGDKILAIHLGGRGYYFDFPVEFDKVVTKSRIVRIIVESESSGQIAKKLFDEGYTHIFIRLKLFNDTIGKILTTEEIDRLNGFLLKHTKQLATNGKYGLFELH